MFPRVSRSGKSLFPKSEILTGLDYRFWQDLVDVSRLMVQNTTGDMGRHQDHKDAWNFMTSSAMRWKSANGIWGRDVGLSVTQEVL